MEKAITHEEYAVTTANGRIPCPGSHRLEKTPNRVLGVSSIMLTFLSCRSALQRTPIHQPKIMRKQEYGGIEAVC